MADAPLNSLATGEPENPVGCPPKGHGPYPLTHAQESLWVAEQLVPGTPVYNVPEAWRIKGRLDTAILQLSLDQIVARHETLRTFFRAVNGKPQQFVLPDTRLKLPAVDLSLDPAGESKLHQLLQQESDKPFDLETAPLAHISLFRLSAAEHVLMINVHHIVWDAWSQGVFIRELVHHYTAIAEGNPPSLPELPIQYVDFALWQREVIQSEFGGRHLAYWQDRFRTPPEPVLLPTDHPRPRRKSFRGATQFHRIPGPLAEGLKELSRREGVTLFMTLLAAFKTLLHKYTGSRRIVVGSPVACRERVEVESLLGFFVHTQPLESDLSGNPTFAELLGRVREVVLEASAHQDLPCQLAVQNSRGENSVGHHPLFQVVFGWQSASPHNWTAPGLSAEKIELATSTAKFDWTILVSESPAGLECRSEFDTDLFEASTMTRLLRQFQVLLENLVASPQARISELPLQTRADCDQLLVDWNRTESAYERDLPIHQVFETTAAATPDAVALEFRGERMTYRVLNGRANQLARELQKSGIPPHSRVGLCLDRSFELIIGLLGILKAGAVYVPLDAELPRERLEFILRDAAVSVVLTHSSLLSRLPRTGKTVVCLDRMPETLSAESAENLPAGAGPKSPAYVMYTSGSTGTPKGVLVPQQAVLRLVRNTNYLEFSAQNVFLQLAPITFDASTFEIWGALLNGARLVIFPSQLPSLDQLGRAIRDAGITTLWLTAGLFHQMIDHQTSNLCGLKHLLAGGDVLSPAHVSKVLRELPDCQLINGYGPTENTTFTCCYRFGRSWPEDQPVPIGRPISNTTVYVLDQNRVPVPIGVPGELYTGGDGLALEYLNQPELTAAKFIHNTFERGNAPRLYRTGDIVRWQPDGNLEFLGRADDQVKIRGYRVEPAEVESVLAGHPAVESAAVVARQDSFLGKHLAAYIVLRLGQEASENDLRQFLEQRLPAYLIPAYLVKLPILPLTPNGKVDRRALPEPNLASLASSQAPPQTPTEIALAEIWCELLGRPHIGVNENFFHLGGHSLLATQVVSRIATACKVDLPVVAIFEAPTVAKLAAAVERAEREQATAPRPPLAAVGPGRAADLLARLEEFSEAELEELLQDPELKNAL